MRPFAIAAFMAIALPVKAQQSQDQPSAQGGSFFSNLFSRPAPEIQPEYFKELGATNENASTFGTEPSLQEIILTEIHDYPKPLDELDLKQRKSCLEEMENIFHLALEDGHYPIPREAYWLEVYPKTGMRIYFCDGSILKKYEDDNREIPARWFSVRNSLTEFLNPLH